MRSTRQVLLVAALLLSSAAIQGCATMIRNWPPWLNLTPPPTVRPLDALRGGRRVVRRYTRSRSRIAIHHSRSHAARVSAEVDRPTAVELTLPSELTLSGEHQDRTKAARLLRSADFSLAEMRKRSPAFGNSAAYRRADALAARAHRALARGDYVAASSLAQKASTLAEAIDKSP